MHVRKDTVTTASLFLITLSDVMRFLVSSLFLSCSFDCDYDDNDDTQRAMEVVGLGVDEVDLVFRLLASLLKLSNLSFLPRANIDATEGCSIVNEYGKS